jgi:hypothetical protein
MRPDSEGNCDNGFRPEGIGNAAPGDHPDARAAHNMAVCSSAEPRE